MAEWSANNFLIRTNVYPPTTLTSDSQAIKVLGMQSNTQDGQGVGTCAGKESAEESRKTKSKNKALHREKCIEKNFSGSCNNNNKITDRE